MRCLGRCAMWVAWGVAWSFTCRVCECIHASLYQADGDGDSLALRPDLAAEVANADCKAARHNAPGAAAAAGRAEDAPDIGDIVVVPERHGEAQFRLSGPDSVRLEPLSATGLGAALLSFSKKGKKSGGGAITVPKATIKLARRATTHLPTSIPSTLDPDVIGAT
ncbi:hypothetical protein HaLaN_05699 [Haematococcus lacustris]|uniref:Secreted protein n=1 Tax=Haematococcus lacustris TaxID=44745 RepID=A0A699YJW4_HAELA|nr:hypothetical protein HaLaN_05699 [Haematococcus lacustris]